MKVFLLQGGEVEKMMKSKFIGATIIIVTVLALLTGCESSQTDTIKYLPNQFQLMTYEKLTEDEKAFVESVKEKAGVYQKDQLIIVSLGKRPTGGYAIELTKAEYKPQELSLYVDVIEPNPGDMVTEVITYPDLIGKVELPENTEIRVYDEKTGKLLFNK